MTATTARRGAGAQRLPAGAAELTEKHRRVLSAARGAGAGEVRLTSPAALAWLLDGARVHVSLAGPPVLQAVVGPDGVDLGVHSNESDRLLAEEIPPGLAETLGLRVHRVRWDRPLEDLDGWLPGSDRGRDPVPEDAIAPALRAARGPLLPAEASRYRALCRDVATAFTAVLAGARPDQTERQLAAAVVAALADAGTEVLVVLVAGESRLTVRHPMPTGAPLGHRAMAVACARRHGLVANLSRWVTMPAGAASGDGTGSGDVGAQDAAGAAVLQVEADVLDALAPGTTFASLLETVQAAYPRHGLPADEWTRHHQGGAAGYAGRDPRLAPGVPDVVQAGQAFAFNPTAQGAKVEDTVLLGPDRVEVLTVDPDWPTTQVRGRARPLPLAVG